MATTSGTLIARELVIQKYQDAHVDDDGEWVRIRVRKNITEPCPHCGQPYTRSAPEFMQKCLGSGGSAEVAWADAAKGLGLL